MQDINLIKQHSESSRVTLDLSILDDSSESSSFDCLIILNIHVSEFMLKRFISRTKAVIITDGAANYLYESSLKDIKNIHSIVGDMDSISPQILQYYQSKGVKISKDDDQDTNDFQKAIILAKENGFKAIVAMGVLGGRIDQELCNLNNIEKYSQSHNLRFVALGTSSLMFMVKGSQTAEIKMSKLCQKNKAGIFCFGKSKASTKGFKWNLDPSYPLEWGKFISSSNQIVASSVQITTEKQLFFTVQLKEQKEQSQLK